MHDHDFIEELLNGLPRVPLQNDDVLEVEARFDIDPRKPRKKYRQKTLSREIVERIAKDIVEHSLQKYECCVERSINFLCNEDIYQLTFIGNEKKESYYKKIPVINPIFVGGFPPYKITASIERPVEPYDALSSCNFARAKMRFSAVIENKYRVDITLIRTIEGLTGHALKNVKAQLLPDISPEEFINAPFNFAHYIEFEIEYIGKSHMTAKDIRFIDRWFDQFMKSQSDYQDTIYRVARLMKGTQHAAAFQNRLGLKQLSNQVHELNSATFALIADKMTEYTMTDKIDGERTLILVDEKTHTIGSKLTIYDNTSVGEPSIFDSEFYNNTYYVFDVMMVNGKSVMDLTHPERIAQFSKIKNISPELKCVVKKFTPLTKNFANEIKTSLAKIKPYDTDGLIFTPVNSDYYATNYKYKPMNKLTVDFLIKECPTKLLGILPYIKKKGKTLYLLCVGINHKRFKEFSMKFIRGYEIMFPHINKSNLPQYFPIPFEPSIRKYAYLYWGDDGLDGKIGEFKIHNYNDNVCKFDWELDRIRVDRDVEVQRGTYFGNDYKVAESIYMNYFSPLVIHKNMKSYFQVSDSQIHKASRNFNSFVKGKILHALTPAIKNLNAKPFVIDLAAGKGQDMFRYRSNGFGTTAFFEVDKVALVELISRKNSPKKSNNTRMNVMIYNVDLTLPHDSIQKIIDDCSPGVSMNSADLIVCNFAFHYFTKDKNTLLNFMKTISYFLKPGGKFLFTGFDGESLLNKLNKSKSKTYESKTPGKFSIKAKSKSARLLPVGQAIDVLLPFSENEYYTEYLININHVSNIAKRVKLTLEHSSSFGGYLDKYARENPQGFGLMDADDKEYVSLYHYYLFHKTSK